MSEPKRATFSTISTQKSEVKKVKDKPKTIRFSLTLPESNEKSCPEYNYRDLLNSAEKKSKIKEKAQSQVNGLNHLDPFDENDDDVKRIARQFEAKYGLPTKKRRGKKDDYADIGAGYDESDSFIDNTDAYDEMVPEDVTTVHGGFYINSGALEFKQVELSGSESSDSEQSNHEKPTSRKRIIEESEDSESEDEKDEPKVEQLEKKQKIETNGVQKPVKKKIISTEESILKKKKIEENLQRKKPVTVKDLLREKREEFDMTVQPETPQKDLKSSISNTINDVIESVVKGKVENADESSKDSSSSSDAVAVVSAASSESESSRDALPGNSEQSKPETELPIVKLPENLPEKVQKIINDIKKAAENSEGKVKFFSGRVNNMLLSLEVNSRKLVRSVRVQIYEHLAPFVKCKKDTLMRRAKNLLLEQERSKLKDPLLRLKIIVDNLMPTVKKNYEKEFQKVRDEMFLASATSANSDGDINNKVRRIPRKKFPWTEETRKILQEILVVQKRCFILEGTRKESFEENLESFLKVSVLPIWTDGFMTIAALMKQTKQILEKIEKPKQVVNPVAPLALDIHSLPTPTSVPPPFHHSPSKGPTPTPPCPTASSAITLIPIPPTNISPKQKSEIVNRKDSSSPSAEIISVPKSKSVENRTNSHESAVCSTKVENDCQIIDLTETPVVVRKPGPKSKTKLLDGSVIKPKKMKEAEKKDLHVEDEMEQVMKDLKELQQLQEHAKKNDFDIMAPSSSPVSVIAFNSNFPKDRKVVDNAGFQEIFQKHLFHDSTAKPAAAPPSVFSASVQPKNNLNSVNNFCYSSAGSISNSVNNIRYSQSSSKYTSAMNHLPTNPTGATNHSDDFALFQNFLFQYGFHNSTGSKQKSPP